MSVGINEPDRLRLDGITHRMELHGIAEKVTNLDYLTGKSDVEEVEEIAVDFRFVSSGYPSAMLHRADLLALQEWLKVWLDSHPPDEGRS